MIKYSFNYFGKLQSLTNYFNQQTLVYTHQTDLNHVLRSRFLNSFTKASNLCLEFKQGFVEKDIIDLIVPIFS